LRAGPGSARARKSRIYVDPTVESTAHWPPGRTDAFTCQKTHLKTNRSTNRTMNRRTNPKTNRDTNAKMNRFTNPKTNRKTNVRTNRKMNRTMNRNTNPSMNLMTNRSTDPTTHPKMHPTTHPTPQLKSSSSRDATRGSTDRRRLTGGQSGSRAAAVQSPAMLTSGRGAVLLVAARARPGPASCGLASVSRESGSAAGSAGRTGRTRCSSRPAGPRTANRCTP